MYWVYFAAAAILNFSAATETLSKNYHVEAANYKNNNYGIAKNTQNNVTDYAEKDENMLRIPALLSYDEMKPRKKSKKSPKRTIQKIIKKNKGKVRKVYFKQVSKIATMTPKVDNGKNYRQDNKKWNAETTTNKQSQKKHRNRNPKTKVQRYHMPFQKLQKKDHGVKDRRHRRGLSRELFILKDLDEIQFLSKERDNDVVVAHITDQWKV